MSERSDVALGPTGIQTKRSRLVSIELQEGAIRHRQPKTESFLEEQFGDGILGQSAGVGTVVYFEFDSVESNQPTKRGKPKITLGGLLDRSDGIVWQPIFNLPVGS